MTNILTRFATAEPTGCAVCHRHAVALGYAPVQKQPMIWLCDSNECHAVAKRVYKMPKRELDAYELGAAREAGNQGGAFLDELGKTDLATLDGEEWSEFLRRIITGFEITMRKRILDGEPPF
jgi:Family of unknown function (DUF6511)